MLQRVMPDLMGLQSVLVINDEAHHCYRHKVSGNGAAFPFSTPVIFCASIKNGCGQAI